MDVPAKNAIREIISIIHYAWFYCSLQSKLFLEWLIIYLKTVSFFLISVMQRRLCRSLSECLKLMTFQSGCKLTCSKIQGRNFLYHSSPCAERYTPRIFWTMEKSEAQWLFSGLQTNLIQMLIIYISDFGNCKIRLGLAEISFENWFWYFLHIKWEYCSPVRSHSPACLLFQFQRRKFSARIRADKKLW